jgi:NTP pyrophosphatase (non-canonical NTP hydrolase)
MTLNEAQTMVDTWIREYGVRYFSELTNLALLMEETGELARIIARKFGEQSVKSTETDSSLADEMADILFVLICLANQTGIDLESAFRSNLEKKTNRDHRRHHDNDKLKR